MKAVSLVFYQQARVGVPIGAPHLFAGLSASDLAQIIESARTRSFQKGDILFSQGQPFRRLLLLEAGNVKITLLNRHGKEVILALRGKSDLVDLPIGTPTFPHSCTAQAVTSGHALTWTAADVEEMMTRMPRLIENMYLILHRHTMELEKRYHEASSDSVARRLACTLIRLSDQLGIVHENGIEIRISRLELAQMCGMTLFTVSRLISRWAKMDLVVPRREALLVLDRERLDEMTSLMEASGEDLTSIF